MSCWIYNFVFQLLWKIFQFCLGNAIFFHFYFNYFNDICYRFFFSPFFPMAGKMQIWAIRRCSKVKLTSTASVCAPLMLMMVCVCVYFWACVWPSATKLQELSISLCHQAVRGVDVCQEDLSSSCHLCGMAA